MIRLLKIYEQKLAVALDGGIFGAYVPPTGFEGLVGNTITFTNPNFNHMFVAGAGTDPRILRLSEVATQLAAASGGALSIRQIDQHLVAVETAPTTGVVMSAGAEVAKQILGLVPSMTGTRVWPSGSGRNPQLAQVFQSHDGNIGCVVVDSPELVTVPTGSYAPVAPAGSGAIATAKKLWSVKVQNVIGFERWLLLVDKAVAPVNGDVPILPLYVPPHGLVDMDWMYGLPLVNGLAWCSSTTPAVVTLSGGADFWPVFGYST